VEWGRISWSSRPRFATRQIGNMVRMSDTKNDTAFPKDYHGETYQGDLTDERTPSPSDREPASHDADLEGEEVDSQEGDAFMRDGKAPS
jgi:hypothetical protein